jgi:hypothetical protein
MRAKLDVQFTMIWALAIGYTTPLKRCKNRSPEEVPHSEPPFAC